MANYTLTYSDGFKGFPSFYSFIPDYMIGMNNYFYTFKGGDLYRHNVNASRNVFYGETAELPSDPYAGAKSRIVSVFNDMPLDNKLFKTINLESSFSGASHSWGGTFDTDIQTTGYIEAGWFEKKEGAWFAFMRNEAGNTAAPTELELRSLGGIGDCSAIDTTTDPPNIYIEFALTTPIGSAISIGDYIYATTSLTPIGEVKEITIDLPNGVNKIRIDPPLANTPVAGNLILYIKNQTAESNGVLGHYCQFELTNTATEAVELFAVETEIMKSFP